MFPLTQMHYLDDALVEYFGNFDAVNTVEELRTVQSRILYLVQDTEYNEQKHSNVLWVFIAKLNQLSLLKAKTQLLLVNCNTEDWFSRNV